MSFAEIVAEIPKLSLEQRADLLRHLHACSFADQPAPGFSAQRLNGRLVLAAPRVIRQSEVDSILDEFP